jgi:hypothetical protein
MRESDKLAEETREMQINLMKIQEQMKKVKSRGGDVEDSDGSSDGGLSGRWRSARADRGGLRQYSKDIKKGKIPRGGGGKQHSGPREMVRSSALSSSSSSSSSSSTSALSLSLFLSPTSSGGRLPLFSSTSYLKSQMLFLI